MERYEKLQGVTSDYSEFVFQLSKTMNPLQMGAYSLLTNWSVAVALKSNLDNALPYSYLNSLKQPLHESLLSCLCAQAWSELCHIFYDSWKKIATNQTSKFTF